MSKEDMFYLMTHLTHFIYGYMISDVAMDNRENERRNPLSPLQWLLPISSKDCTYYGLCYTSYGPLAGMRNSSMGPRGGG